MIKKKSKIADEKCGKYIIISLLVSIWR